MERFDPTWKETPELPGELEDEDDLALLEQRKVSISWTETVEYAATIRLPVPQGATDEMIRSLVVENDDTTLWYREVNRQNRPGCGINVRKVEAVQLLSVDPIDDD